MSFRPFSGLMMDGGFVAINEQTFEEEVLARRGPGRVFEMESMERFHALRELPKVPNLSVSGNEFPAEEAAASAPRKVHPFLCTGTGGRH